MWIIPFLDLLLNGGARVLDDRLVQFPSALVEDAIASAPSNLVLFNRNKVPVMDLGGRRICFGTGTDLPKTVNLETTEIRNTRADGIVTNKIISDARYPDLQTGAEYGFTLLNAAPDGAILIHDCGYLGQGFVASPELIILADETIGMVKRYMRGFDIDSEHLALDVIKQVGPGGNFLL